MSRIITILEARLATLIPAAMDRFGDETWEMGEEALNDSKRSTK